MEIQLLISQQYSVKLFEKNEILPQSRTQVSQHRDFKTCLLLWIMGYTVGYNAKLHCAVLFLARGWTCFKDSFHIVGLSPTMFLKKIKEKGQWKTNGKGTQWCSAKRCLWSLNEL